MRVSTTGRYGGCQAWAPDVNGVDDIGVYIACLQNTVAQFIVTCHIMDLCLAEERKPGLCLSKRWWDQTDLDILGIRAGYVVSEVGWGGGGRGIRRNRKEREKERKIGKYGGRKTETNRIAKYKQKEI